MKYKLTSGDDVVTGTFGGDLVDGYKRVFTDTGTRLSFSGGSDQISTGGARDEIYVFTDRAQIDAGANHDIVVAWLNKGTANVIHGGSGNDKIEVRTYGKAGARVFGDDGNDTFRYLMSGHEAGTIHYNGGGGIDTLEILEDHANIVTFKHATVTSIENLLLKDDIIFTGDMPAFQTITVDTGAAGSKPHRIIVEGGWHGTVIGRATIESHAANVRIDLSSTSGSLTVDTGRVIRDGAWIALDGKASVRGGSGDDRITAHGLRGDYISGGGGNDRLNGGDGNDTLLGGRGRDTVYGAAGDDHIDGGNDNDTLFGGVGDDTLIGGPGADRLVGNIGIDTVVYNAGAVVANLVDSSLNGGEAAGDTYEGIENLSGSGSDDALTGNADANVLSGNGGDDTLTGGGGDDSLSGGSGNNLLAGGDGNDTLSALEGNDTLDGGNGSDALSGSRGADRLDGGDGNDTLLGGNNADALMGGTGDDSLVAGADDYDPDSEDPMTPNGDVLEGGAGADTLVGSSSGWTIASYEHSAAGVTVNLDTGATSGDAQGDILMSIQNLIGSAYDDVLTGSSSPEWYGESRNIHGGAGNDTIYSTTPYALFGDAGNDYIDAGVNVGEFVVHDIHGGDGDDTIHSANPYAVFGEAGNDYIDADGGYVDGGSGDDTFIGHDLPIRDLGVYDDDPPLDVIVGGDGYDTVDFSGSSGDILVNQVYESDYQDTRVSQRISQVEHIIGSSFGSSINLDDFVQLFDGGAGNDSIVGGTSAVTLNGNGGNDMLTGSGGNDTLDGGSGDDVLAGGAGTDIMSGGDGSDTVSYTGSAIVANLADATLNTGNAAGDSYAGIENLSGTAGNDTLGGDAGANILTGNSGDDLLHGNDGNDTLIGNQGTDTFDGGGGFDIVSYVGDGVVANLTHPDLNGGDAAGETYISIEGLSGTDSDDSLIGNAAANFLSGNIGQDTLVGGDGNDTLVGGDGSDTLRGGDGDDTLISGGGNDAVRGDAGADLFVLSGSGEEFSSIADFQNGSDRIDLSFYHTSFAALEMEPIGVEGNYTGALVYAHDGDNTLQIYLPDVDVTTLDPTDFLF